MSNLQKQVADLVAKKQLSMQAAHQTQLRDQLTAAQRDQSRLEHDNHILKRGFNSIMKKQSEWCKASEKVE